VIYIDLRADLNAEDDGGRNIALLRDAVDPSSVVPGAGVVAGMSTFWSWVVDAVDDGVVYLQVSARDAADRGPLVVPIPSSASV
jgi:hypothetical protein